MIPDPRNDGKAKRLTVIGTKAPKKNKNAKKATEAAQALQAQWQAEHEAANAKPAAPEPDTFYSLTDFLVLVNSDPGMSKVNDELSPLTVKRRAEIWTTFAGWFIEKAGEAADAINVLSFSREVFDQFRAHRLQVGVGAGLLREFTQLHRGFRYANECGRFPDKNPVPNLSKRKLKLDEKRKDVKGKAYTPIEVEQILKAAYEGWPKAVKCERDDGFGNKTKYTRKTQVTPPAYLGPMLEIAYETGLRPEELRNLTWPAVTRDDGCLYVEPETSKASSARPIPLSPRAKAVLASLQRQESVFLFTMDGRHQVTYTAARNALRRVLRYLQSKEKKRLERLAKRGGREVPKDGPKTELFRPRGLRGFRHAFGLRLGREKFPVHQIMKLMGHTDVRTTMIYLDEDPTEFAKDFRTVMGKTQVGGA